MVEWVGEAVNAWQGEYSFRYLERQATDVRRRFGPVPGRHRARNIVRSHAGAGMDRSSSAG